MVYPQFVAPRREPIHGRITVSSLLIRFKKRLWHTPDTHAVRGLLTPHPRWTEGLHPAWLGIAAPCERRPNGRTSGSVGRTATTESNRNSSQNNDDNRRTNGNRRKIEPARKAPDSERGLTSSPYFNGPFYEHWSHDLHPGGVANRTPAGYIRAVRQLADCCKMSIDLITEDQLRIL